MLAAPANAAKGGERRLCAGMTDKIAGTEAMFESGKALALPQQAFIKTGISEVCCQSPVPEKFDLGNC